MKEKQLILINRFLDKINKEIIHKGATDDLLSDKITLEFFRDTLSLGKDFDSIK